MTRIPRSAPPARFAPPAAILALGPLLLLAASLTACETTPEPAATPGDASATAITAGAPTNSSSGGIILPTSELPADDPEAVATGLYDAWRRDDRATADTLAEPAAATELFSRTWHQTDGWDYDGCEGAAGSTYCTWHTTAGQLIIRVRNPGAGLPMQAIEVRFEVNTPVPTGVSGSAAETANAPAATATLAYPTVAAARTSTPTELPAGRQTSTAGGQASDILRRADWPTVMRTTRGLVVDPSVPSLPGHEAEPFVTVQSLGTTGGYAVIGRDRILFTDISGEGVEEAIVSLASGGTAGNTAILVFQAVGASPKLADALAGYKIGAAADGPNLKVIEPIYAGWEPNCCPSGEFQTRYRLVGGKLTQQSRIELPYPEAKRMTVERFYELLGEKNYTDAYNQFLGDTFRRANPYDPWLKGYQNTIKFEYETSDRPDGTVGVKLTATDQTAAGSVIHHYEGSWTLKWVSTARLKQWMLEAASFKEVN